MRCVELSATWIKATGATSRVSYLLFPVILFNDINITHVYLFYYMYHALLLILNIVKFQYNKYNMGMGDLMVD